MNVWCHDAVANPDQCRSALQLHSDNMQGSRIQIDAVDFHDADFVTDTACHELV